MTPKQLAARAAFKTYLSETYGSDYAGLIYNIADLESNFKADATNSRSSAAGLTQITSGHWDTLSEYVKRKLARGEMTPADLPAGMTPTNLANFDQHKFDEISSAFMTRQNIDFLGERFVVRANKQREMAGLPKVRNMRELTGGNFALESMLIAGAHKDGWGVHSAGKLKGTGFGAAIKNGVVDLDSLFSAYAENRAMNERAGEQITDGMGHGLTYALYASDNVMESAGGPKLQLTPQQVKTGFSVKADNVSVKNRLSQPWIDRAQQADPGFDPNDDTFDQWLTRLDLVDQDQVLGANDIQSTDVISDLPSVARANPPTPVALPEARAQSEDPTVAARAGNRFANRTQRAATDALGGALDFLIPEVNAETTVPGQPKLNRNSSVQRVEDERKSRGELGRDAAKDLKKLGPAIRENLSEGVDTTIENFKNLGQGALNFGKEVADFLNSGDAARDRAIAEFDAGRQLRRGEDPTLLEGFTSELLGVDDIAADAQAKIDSLQAEREYVLKNGRPSLRTDIAETLGGEKEFGDGLFNTTARDKLPNAPGGTPPSALANAPGGLIDTTPPNAPGGTPTSSLPNAPGGNIGTLSTAEQAEIYGEYGITRNFSDYEKGVRNTVEKFNERERGISANIEESVAERAAQLRAEDQQDLAISLSNIGSLNFTDPLPYQRATRANAARRPSRINLDSVVPSAKTLKGIVNYNRNDNSDYEFAAAAQLLAEQERGSLNDVINRSRGTNFEEQADIRAVEAARLGLKQIEAGNLTPEFLQEQRTTTEAERINNEIARLMTLRSRGL